MNRGMGTKVNLWLVGVLWVFLTLGVASGVTQYQEMFSIFQPVHVHEREMVLGDVVVLFNDTYIQGHVTGDVFTLLGKIHVSGTIEGDAISIFGGIEIDETGRVMGNSVGILGQGVLNQGYVGKEIFSVLSFAILSGFLPGFFIMMLCLTLVKQGLAVGVSLIMMLLFPTRFDRMAEGISQNKGGKLLIGLLIYAGALIGAVVLVMTIIGAPLVVLLIPAILILGFMGNVTGKIALGKGFGKKLNKNWSNIMELLVGTVIFTILDITLVGSMLTFIIKLVGVGELFHSRFGEAVDLKGVR